MKTNLWCIGLSCVLRYQHPIQLPIPVQAALLPTSFPVMCLGKQVKMAPASACETQVKLLAHLLLASPATGAIYGKNISVSSPQ